MTAPQLHSDLPSMDCAELERCFNGLRQVFPGRIPWGALSTVVNGIQYRMLVLGAGGDERTLDVEQERELRSLRSLCDRVAGLVTTPSGSRY